MRLVIKQIDPEGFCEAIEKENLQESMRLINKLHCVFAPCEVIEHARNRNQQEQPRHDPAKYEE